MAGQFEFLSEQTMNCGGQSESATLRLSGQGPSANHNKILYSKAISVLGQLNLSGPAADVLVLPSFVLSAAFVIRQPDMPGGVFPPLGPCRHTVLFHSSAAQVTLVGCCCPEKVFHKSLAPNQRAGCHCWESAC